MKKIKVLNLYAGIGGNRKLWPDDEIEVTAVEYNKEIAAIYQDFFPNDKVIVADAHKYLLDHYKEFDFIWSSPPCPTHSQFRQRCGVKAWGQKPKYPDMTLWQEIIFLKYHFKGLYVIENVIPYYPDQFQPQEVGRHYFWANFKICDKKGFQPLAIKSSEIKDLEQLHNFDLKKYKIKNKRQILRNCVLPALGRYIWDSTFKDKQVTLNAIRT